MSIVNFYSFEKYPERTFGYLNVGYLECLVFVYPSSFAKIQEYRRTSEKRTIFLPQRTIRLPTLGEILVSHYQSMLLILGSGNHHMN